MPISSITTNDTVSLLVTRVGQLITAYNVLEANGSITSANLAQTAFAQANTSLTVGSSAFGKANSANIVGSAAFDKANAANVLANSAYTFANTLPANITSAFAQANAAYNAANTASAAAAPGFNAANAAFAQANTSRDHANAAFAVANSGSTIGSSAFGAANAAFAKANTAGSNTAPGILQMANTYNYRQKSNTQLTIGLTDAWNAVRPVSLSPNGTLYIDMTSGINFNVTLNSATVITPTNTANSIGQTGLVRLKQNTSGGSLASYHVDFEFANSVAPTLSTNGNAEDILFYVILDANRVFATLQKAVG